MEALRDEYLDPTWSLMRSTCTKKELITYRGQRYRRADFRVSWYWTGMQKYFIVLFLVFYTIL